MEMAHEKCKGESADIKVVLAETDEGLSTLLGVFDSQPFWRVWP